MLAVPNKQAKQESKPEAGHYQKMSARIEIEAQLKRLAKQL
jgi:hypothetical protein